MSSNKEEKRQHDVQLAGKVAETGGGGSMNRAGEAESHLPLKSAPQQPSAASASASAPASPQPHLQRHNGHRSVYTHQRLHPATAAYCKAMEASQAASTMLVWSVAEQRYVEVSTAAPSVEAVNWCSPYKPRKAAPPPADPEPQLPLGDTPLMQPDKLQRLQELYSELHSTEQAIQWIGKYLPKLAVNDELAANKARLKAEIAEVLNK